MKILIVSRAPKWLIFQNSVTITDSKIHYSRISPRWTPMEINFISVLYISYSIIGDLKLFLFKHLSSTNCTDLGPTHLSFEYTAIESMS